MPSMSTRFSLDGEQRFALLMIVVSVVVFTILRRAEKR